MTEDTTPKSSEEILKGSFSHFLYFVFTHVLMLPKPTRVQLDIARFLADNERPLRMISAFRGVGKSFITCAFVVWRLWRDPNLKCLVVSANETLATENATLVKLIIESEAGRDLWGSLRTPLGARSSTLAFDVGGCVPDKSPSVKVAGITGQITGSRSDILISDDCEVPKNSATESQRDKLRELTKEYGAVAKPGSEIIWLGTPQTQESIYKALPAQGYTVRVWPSRYPLHEKMATYEGHLAPMLLADMEREASLGRPTATSLGGSPTDPARFHEHQLRTQELVMGGATFMLQMMLDTSLSDADRYPLKTRDFVTMDVDPKIAPIRVAWSSSPDLAHKDLVNVGFDGDRFFRPMFTAPEFQEYTGSVMVIDPSGRGRDETAYCVSKFLNGQVFITRWGGFKDGFGETTLRALADIAGEEGVQKIKVESNFGDGMWSKLFEPYIRRRHPCEIEEYKVSGQKELRILETLRPALAQHRVVITPQVVRKDLAEPDNVRRGLYQLTHLTSARGSLRHDDRVEVLSEAVKAWAEVMNADAHAAEAAYKRKADEAWEKEYFSGTFVGQAIEKGRERGGGRPKSRIARRRGW